jgi:hypothetical protein
MNYFVYDIKKAWVTKVKFYMGGKKLFWIVLKVLPTCILRRKLLMQFFLGWTSEQCTSIVSNRELFFCTNKIFSDYLPTPVAKSGGRFGVHLYPHRQGLLSGWRFREHFTLHQGLTSADITHYTLKKGTRMIPETSVVFNKLARLLGRKDFINF